MIKIGHAEARYLNAKMVLPPMDNTTRTMDYQK